MEKTGIEHDKDWNRALAKIGIEHGVDENKAWQSLEWNRTLANAGTELWQRLEQNIGKDWNRAFQRLEHTKDKTGTELCQRLE